MNITIETKRLLIRPVTVDDAEAIFRWASDPEVTKFMLYTTHPNVESTREWLATRDIEDPDSYDLGIALKETGELIGMGGLVYCSEGDYFEIGYNLRRDHWGEGIIPEAMQAIIDEILKVRPIRVLEGRFAKDNPKSGRVMEKLGMTYYGETEYTKFDGTATFPAYIYRKEF